MPILDKFKKDGPGMPNKVTKDGDENVTNNNTVDNSVVDNDDNANQEGTSNVTTNDDNVSVVDVDNDSSDIDGVDKKEEKEVNTDSIDNDDNSVDNADNVNEVNDDDNEDSDDEDNENDKDNVLKVQIETLTSENEALKKELLEIKKNTVIEKYGIDDEFFESVAGETIEEKEASIKKIQDAFKKINKFNLPKYRETKQEVGEIKLFRA